MKLLESIGDYGHKIDQAIQAIAKDMLKYDMSGDEAKNIASGLSLSNILTLDTAVEEEDTETVAAILGVGSLTEYSLGGMAGRAASSTKSAASDRNEKNRRKDPSSTLSQPKAGADEVKPTGQSQSTQQATKPEDEEPQTPDAETEEDDDQMANDIADLKKKAGIK